MKNILQSPENLVSLNCRRGESENSPFYNLIIERRFIQQNMLQPIAMQFTAEVYEFTNKNIDLFITPMFARTKKENYVKRFRNFLISNNYQFGSAITVVKTNSGKFLVIDGNHRVEAFREALNSGNTKGVYSVLIIYPTMHLEQMKEMMQLLGSNVQKQNCDSMFEVWEKDIYIWKNADKLPIKISIRNKKGFFRLINLINFLEVKESNKMPFQHSLNRTVEVAKNSNAKDLEFLRNFLVFFEDRFGKITFENKYAVPCFMTPLASIYGVNFEKIAKDMEGSRFRFQNLLQDPEIIDLLAIGGKSRQMLHAVRNRQIVVLNRKLIKNQELFE